MAQLIDLSLIPVLDGDGDTVSGATLRFYQSGTLNGVTVFQNSALTVPHPTPIVADGAGRFPAVYVSGAQALRARIEQGVSILRDVDPVITPFDASSLVITGADVDVTGGTLQTVLDGIDTRLDQRPNARDFGAVGSGSVNDGPALQAFIDAGGGFIPPGTYRLDAALVMKPDTDVTAHPEARFLCGVNNMAMVWVDDGQNAFKWSWRGGTFEPNGKTGCRVFSLRQAHLHGTVSQTHIVGAFLHGFYLRELCWGLVMIDNYMSGCAVGIEALNGSNTVGIYSNKIENFTAHGILLQPGTVALPVVGVSMRDNVVQFGPIGIEDRSRGSLMSNNYIEGCTVADIYLNGAIGSVVEYGYHSANTGVVAVKGRDSTGCHVHHVRLQGTRSGGLFDFDNSNASCTGELNRQGSAGAALGITTGLKLKENLNGNPEVGDIGVDANFVPRVGTLLGGTVVTRSIDNGLSVVAHLSITGTAINAAQSAEVVYGVINAPTAITFTNLAANQTIRLLIEVASGFSTLTVAGKTIDMTGAAAGERCWIEVTRIVTASPAVDITHVTQTTWQ